MRAKWVNQKKLKPQVIMDKMREITTVTGDGVSFETFMKFELDAVILNIVEFDPKYSYPTRKRFYDDALQICAERNDFLEKSLIEEINKRIVRYGKIPEVEFDYIFPLSLASSFPLTDLVVNGSKITFMKKGLQRKYKTRDLHLWNKSYPALPEDYLPVRVRCRARDYLDGFEKALYDIDFLRGVLCLLTNSEFQFSFGPKYLGPLNKVILGGMHSAHLPDGSLANEKYYWYERHDPVRKPLAIKSKDEALLRKNVKWILNNIQAHPNSLMLKDAVIRYARAFDEIDRNVTIQKAWAAIESIVSPQQNNADLIVKRCSFMYEDAEYRVQVLEHLRDYRNRNVHTGYESEELETHCYQLQIFFKQAVFFYLRHRQYFKDIHEANSFLDLPDDIAKLTRRKELTIKALKFLGPGSK